MKFLRNSDLKAILNVKIRRLTKPKVSEQIPQCISSCCGGHFLFDYHSMCYADIASQSFENHAGGVDQEFD